VIPVAVGLLAVLLIAGAGVIATRSSWVRHEWRLSFSRLDQPYPQLYFSTSAPLPSSAPAGSVVSVPFSVTNVADSAHSYAWSAVVRRSDGTEERVGAGTVHPGGHETAGATVTFTVPRGARVFAVQLQGWRTPIFFHFVGDRS
jgi:hypothetical protein